MTLRVRFCLRFDGGGADAARLCTSLLPGSLIENTLPPDAGDVQDRHCRHRGRLCRGRARV